MKRFLALLLLAYGVASAQQVDGQTGNIVYTTLNPPPPGAPYTWNGFVNLNTGGGGLQGGDIPAYNSQTGTFIWGYMPGTVAYTTAVNFALAAAGTGIQVNGFKYSWQYFNQDFSRGTLSGSISLTSNNGKLLENYNYIMPQTTEGWTLMSGIQNFSTQYAPPSLGNLQVSFSGKDDRFWAGYYGPQVRDIDVKLLYSTGSQPPASNTTCTTYSIDPACIAQSSLTSSTTTANYTPVATVVIENDTPILSAPTTTSSGSTTSNNVASSTTTQLNTAPTSSTTGSTTAATTSNVVSKESKDNPSGASIGLSVIAKNQQREQAIAMQAAQNAVAAAEQTAQQVQQDAVATAQSSSNASVVSSGGSANRTVTTANVVSSSAQQSTAGVTQALTIGLLQLPQPLSQQTAQQNTGTAFESTSQVATQTLSTSHQHNAPAPEVAGFDSQKMLLDRTSPLFQTLDNKPIEIQNTTSFSTGPVVNKNAQNNDLAVGVDLNRIAQTPGGYNEYLSLALKDVAFYAPKEVYKNQRNVDNVRALRSLSSDRLHQDMVDQQYRK